MASDETPPPEEILNYGILGEDEATTEEKLEKYTGEVDWTYLEPHYRNGALLYVDPTLSLTEVGKALADDNAAKVQEWKERGDLVTPSTPHAFYWDESGATFRALVVSPFVLIQPIPDGKEPG